MAGSTGVDRTSLQMVATAIVASDIRGGITARSGASVCGESGSFVGGGCGEAISGDESSWGGEDGDSNIVYDGGEGSDGGRSGDEGGKDDGGGEGVTAAPVVRETGIDKSQALSPVGVPVLISFFWAF